MKNVRYALLATCLLLSLVVNAGSPVDPSGPSISTHPIMTDSSVPYLDVVDCGSVSQADLFRRARLWLVQAAAGESLALSDAQTGDLVGSLTPVVTLPRSETSAGGVYRFRCMMVIECANRKYRATITHIALEENGNTQPISLQTYRQKAPAVYAELDRQLKTLLTALQQDVNGYKPF